MTASESYDHFRTALAPGGLNLFGVLAGADYDTLCPRAFQRRAVAPDARSAIVVGNGGRAMWDAIAHAPEWDRPHPINRFTQRVIQQAALAHLTPAAPTLCLWPNDARAGGFLPAMSLAMGCGIGVPSKLVILINPDYGLWVGLRAIVLTALELDPTPPLAERVFNPCSGCPAPCAQVCHGAVITPAGFDGSACLATRVTKRACRRTCDARLACPVGAEHAYAADQMTHTSRHLVGPATMGRYALFAVKRRFSRR